LLNQVIIVQVRDVLAQEVHSPVFHHLILLGHDLALKLDVVVGIPLGSWSNTVTVLYLDYLSQDLKTNSMQGLG
jgi:hypothetical protein